MPRILGDGLKDLFLKFNFRGPGNSTFANSSDGLFYLIYVLSAIFFVLLMVMMVVFTLKYRKKPGRIPQRSAAHNTMLELAWSVIPTMLLVWMFFRGFWGYTDALIAPSNAPELMLTAKKWAWNVTYPNGGVSSEVTRTRDLSRPDLVEAVQDTPIFYVPVDQPVKFRMSSEDVIHSFWVPDMRAKFDVFPNRYTSVWFHPKEIRGNQKLKDGTPYEDHWVFCAEYCGSNHSEMSAVIRVVPVDYFKKWMVAAATPTGSLAERGEKYYRIKGCNSCHSIDGSRNVGPTWKDLYGHPVEFTDGTSLTAEQMTGTEFANYIRESVYNPAVKIVKGYPNQMAAQMTVTPDELACLIAYMSSAKLTSKPAPQLGEETKPAETPEKK